MTFIWTELAPPTSDPGDRENYGLAFDSFRREMVMSVGFPFTALVPGAWSFGGTDWLTDATKPSWGRENYVAYDPLLKYVLQFGGTRGGGVMIDHTWKRDGSGWTQFSPVAASPSGRRGGLCAYCPAINQILVYGGWAGSTSWPTDTRSWNGATWLDLAPANDPGEADSISGCTFGDGVLAFARNDPIGGETDETSFFDGEDWSLLSPGTSPPARSHPAMGLHVPTGKALMFGGLASGVRLNDLWSYDDGTWTEEIPNGALGSPAIRAEMSMAYDENLGCMLMYGGGVGGGDQLADTWKLCTDQTDDFYTILHTFGLND